MSIEEFRDVLEEYEPDILLYPDYEGAFVGIARRAGGDAIAVYDYHKCIEILMDDNSISREEAEEYFEFNTACAYFGERTPCILHRNPE